MTHYELLSILIALVAAVISLVAWFGQRKLQREANELQRSTADLAQKQLEMIEREETSRREVRLSVALERFGTSYRFLVSNVGEQEAWNVELLFLFLDPQLNPIVHSEYIEKFPVPVLHAGESVSLIAALADRSPTAYHVRLTWKDPNGKVGQREVSVALQA
jgi:hypothetical protein